MVPMLTEARQARIVAHVRSEGFATVAHLAQLVGVSEATVRRDLVTLSTLGRLRRLRGGASDLRGAVDPERDLRDFDDVAAAAREAKRRIAARACAFVEDGAVVALDAGTTVAHMAQHLRERALTVVTTNLAVVEALEGAPGIELIVVGGQVRPNYRSVVGLWAERMLAQVRVEHAFLGTSGVGADGSVLDSTPAEAAVKQALLRSSSRATLLADAEKFPGSGHARVAGLERFERIVTDVLPPAGSVPEGVEVVVA